MNDSGWKAGIWLARASAVMTACLFGLALALGAPGVAAAQAAASAGSSPGSATAATAMATAVAPAPQVTAPAATPLGTSAHFAVAPGGYTPMAPTIGKGMPVDPNTNFAGSMAFQNQYSPNGEFALWMHNTFLLPVVFIVSIFVLALLVFVVFRFNAKANPVPSRTTHNTKLEVLWTAIPTLILVVIFIPSMQLLAKQYQPLPANAVTVKATGNQWYWTYTYPDNGGFDVTSNMLPDDVAKAKGEPPQLAADYRMVVPVGEPIRLQTTGADVIHSFAVPSLWFKLDAVPGRVNERVLFIKEPGVYYGQCSELCGARHGYMPIVVEALDRPHYNAWVLTHSGGRIDGSPAAPAAGTAAPSV